MGTIRGKDGTKDSLEVGRELLNVFLEIAMYPVWSRMREAVVEAVSSRLDAFAKTQDERWAKHLGKVATAKEESLAAEVARLQNDLATARQQIERLAEECRSLKDDQTLAPTSGDSQSSAVNVTPRAQVFSADIDGVKAAVGIAGERVIQQGIASSDVRKRAFIAELRLLIPSASERIFTTDSDNVIFVQTERKDQPGSTFSEWLIVLNRVSSDSVGPAVGMVFRGPDGGPTGALNRRYNEIELIRPAVIPADVRFAAEDPYVARDYVRVERIERGVLRVI